MRTMVLLEIMMNAPKNVPLLELSKEMELSEKSIRNLIKDANENGRKHGFQIRLKRGDGYFLTISNEKAFNVFFKPDQIRRADVYNASQRMDLLLFCIFQKKEYFTVEELSETLGISKATITRDLPRIEELLQEAELTLERRAHYGLRIVGDEKAYRSGFSRYVIHSEMYLEPTHEFFSFKNNFNTLELKKCIITLLKDNGYKVTDFALDNILSHILILIYRAKNNNFVTESAFAEPMSDFGFVETANKISKWIKDNYQITLPEIEEKFLSVHLSGKVTVEKLKGKERENLIAEIDTIFSELDNEFLTDFAEDAFLRESILMHLFPLINRLYNNLKLDNPLIDEVYTKYSNVFLIALRFGEYIEKRYGLQLSRDEIGYIALHFAAHFEKRRNSIINKFKRIVVICNTGGGSAQLLRFKLESLFSNALIVTTSINDLDKFIENKPDLFLTTIPLTEENWRKGIPLIHIKHVLDDGELKRIQDTLPLISQHSSIQDGDSSLIQLFDEAFFYSDMDEGYLEMISKQADDLIVAKLAPDGYKESVLDRENKFTTIYKNGVAGPHPLKLNGFHDVISVAILRTNKVWADKEVKMIFLINLRPGHLFIHREISKFLLQVMEDKEFRERLQKATTFQEFLNEIKNKNHR